MEWYKDISKVIAVLAIGFGAYQTLDRYAPKEQINYVSTQHQLDTTSQQIYNYTQEQYQLEDRNVNVGMTDSERRRYEEVTNAKNRAIERQKVLEQKILGK